MSVIVTDTGFGPDDFIPGFPAASDVHGGTEIIALAPDTDPALLPDIARAAQAIVIDFPAFNDGRGFTLARLLRQAGFTGRLRARGHVIADQYTMARRAGFDEVEISDDLAARQPQAQWMARANWRAHDYQSRLRG